MPQRTTHRPASNPPAPQWRRSTLSPTTAESRTPTRLTAPVSRSRTPAPTRTTCRSVRVATARGSTFGRAVRCSSSTGSRRARSHGAALVPPGGVVRVDAERQFGVSPPRVWDDQRRWSVVLGTMARCTAPVYGHRTASGAAACPVHGGRYGSYRSYSAPPSYPPVYQSRTSGGGSSGGGGSGGGGTRPRWSPSSSSVTYTAEQVRALTPYRRTIESQGPWPNFATSSFAMRGTTGAVLPRS
jgi:hypothetical protein